MSHSFLTELKAPDLFSVYSFQGFCIHCFLLPVWLNMLLLLQTNLVCVYVYVFVLFFLHLRSVLTAEPVCKFQGDLHAFSSRLPDVTTVYSLLY